MKPPINLLLSCICHQNIVQLVTKTAEEIMAHAKYIHHISHHIQVLRLLIYNNLLASSKINFSTILPWSTSLFFSKSNKPPMHRPLNFIPKTSKKETLIFTSCTIKLEWSWSSSLHIKHTEIRKIEYNGEEY